MIGGFLGIFAGGCGASDVPGQDHFCQKSPGILLCALIAKYECQGRHIVVTLLPFHILLSHTYIGGIPLSFVMLSSY